MENMENNKEFKEGFDEGFELGADAAVKILDELAGDSFDMDQFRDPTFEITQKTYVYRLGEAMMIFENMIDNYGQVCIDDVVLAAKYLLTVIAARWDCININKSKKFFEIQRLMRKYPWVKKVE